MFRIKERIKAYINAEVNRQLKSEAVRCEVLSNPAQQSGYFEPHLIDPFEMHHRGVVKELTCGVEALYNVDVEGDIAEFGTMSGVTALALVRAIALCDYHLGYAVRAAGLPLKNIHLFDSFEGLPLVSDPIDSESPHVKTGIWAPASCSGLSSKQLFERVSGVIDTSRINIYEGWFCETVPRISEGTKFCLIHIDSDLYVSAIDVLEGLFSRSIISHGAYIFFDDWNCNKGAPEYGERKAWNEVVKKYDVRYSDEGSYGLVAHKFIVHSYKH